MFRHKSLGLLSAMIVTPRIAYRLFSPGAYNVKEIVGISSLESIAAKAGHYALYGFMTVMPATGIAMGYYGGKGLPFFYTTVPGIKSTDDETKKRNGGIAKQSFKLHKQIGTYGKFL